MEKLQAYVILSAGDIKKLLNHVKNEKDSHCILLETTVEKANGKWQIDSYKLTHNTPLHSKPL